MLKFDLTSLELFVAVVEQRNIARASRANNIAQSAVSKRISDLEARLGARLLERSKEGVRPTSAGQSLYDQAIEILRLARLAGASLGSNLSKATGVVRLWSNTSAIVRYLPEDLARFTSVNTMVTIELQEASSEDIICALEDGHADVGIISDHVHKGRLTSEPYLTDDLVVIVPPSHDLSGKPSIGLAELNEFDNLGLSLSGSSTHNHRRIRSRVLDFVGIQKMVAAGLGVAVMPKSAISRPSLDVTIVELEHPLATRELLIVYSEERALSGAARAFVEFLRANSR